MNVTWMMAPIPQQGVKQLACDDKVDVPVPDSRDTGERDIPTVPATVGAPPEGVRLLLEVRL